MFSVSIKFNGKIYNKQYEDKVLLSEVIKAFKLPFSMPCGGRGICGKCLVDAKGALEPPSDGNKVPACRTWAVGDAEIIFDEIKADVISDGCAPEACPDPIIENGYAMAVDIGTTTAAAYIYKFPEGREVKRICLANPQRLHGADVISRIEYANSGGLETLRSEMRGLLQRFGEGYKIEKYIAAGNTAMLCFLAGVSPGGMAVYPYDAPELFGRWQDNIYLMPCMSAYVGGDITSAITAADMMSDKTSLLIDIGTNGETALWHKGVLYCCSAPAGPAFEGYEISCGMEAAPGAVSRVSVSCGEIHFETIGNEPPAGICGSGLIDLLACLLRLRKIDKTGYMKEEFSLGGIRLTGQDVRRLQLAKSAVRSGLDALINRLDITYDDIDVFYIAGGFGSRINIENAARIGLIPKELVKKARVLGNASGTGAVMHLKDKKLFEKSRSIAENAVTAELSTDKFFIEKYIENMNF